MKVTLYSVDQTTSEETLVAEGASLEDLLPDEPGENNTDWRRDIQRALETHGGCWWGGGAAELFRLRAE